MKASALLARLWRGYVARHMTEVIALVPALMAVAAAASAYGFILKLSVDWLTAGNLAAAAWAPAMVIGATGVRAIAIWAQAILTQSLALKVLRDLQEDMFTHLIRADFARFGREETGKLASRFINDVGVVSDGLSRAFQAVLRDALTLVGAIASMIYFDWVLAGLVVLIFLLAGRPLARIAARARRQTTMAQLQIGELLALLTESIGAARFIKTYRLEERESARAAAAFEARRKLTMKLVYNRARSDPLLEILGGLALALIIGVAGWRIAQGHMTLGDLIGIVGAFGVAAPSARALGSFNTVLNEAIAALTRIFSIVDETPTIKDAPGARALAVREGAVAFENVFFGYGQEPALRGVSFTAAKGERIALVGPSGAGKSTLFNLITRLYDPDSGRVLIDGQDIKEATLASVRQAVALVAQDSTLFGGTIRENILLGRPDADDAAIEAAARAAFAHDFILAQPDGYATQVGERGGNLSGGERQRIALARAFLRDAPILLLDEATSALDAAAEAKVQEALARLSAGRTTLVIAHRLATVRDADRIIVLENGAIREQGRHEELLAAGGLYAELHRLQFQD